MPYFLQGDNAHRDSMHYNDKWDTRSGIAEDEREGVSNKAASIGRQRTKRSSPFPQSIECDELHLIPPPNSPSRNLRAATVRVLYLRTCVHLCVRKVTGDAA